MRGKMYRMYIQTKGLVIFVDVVRMVNVFHITSLPRGQCLKEARVVWRKKCPLRDHLHGLLSRTHKNFGVRNANPNLSDLSF